MRRRRLILGVGVLATSAVAVAFALAQESDQVDAPAESESAHPSHVTVISFGEQPNFDPGVPRGPRIAFCPTPEQIQAHLALYGFDYKPDLPSGVGCGREGQYRVPAELQMADPRESLSELERCRLEKESLLEAEPIPSDDPLTLRGSKADGGETGVDLDADPAFLKRKGIDDIHDWARRLPC